MNKPAQHQTPCLGAEVLKGTLLKAFIKTSQQSFFFSSNTSDGLDLSGVAYLVEKVAEELAKVKQWSSFSIHSDPLQGGLCDNDRLCSIYKSLSNILTYRVDGGSPSAVLDYRRRAIRTFGYHIRDSELQWANF